MKKITRRLFTAITLACGMCASDADGALLAQKIFWTDIHSGEVTMSYAGGSRWRLGANTAGIVYSGTTSGTGNGEKFSFVIPKNTTGKGRTIQIPTEFYREVDDGHLEVQDGIVVWVPNIVTRWVLIPIYIDQVECMEYHAFSTSLDNGGRNICGAVAIDYSDLNGEPFSFSANGKVIVSTSDSGRFIWRPAVTGVYEIECTKGTNAWTTILNVHDVDGYAQPAPNPPDTQNSRISITPTTRNFGVEGGGNAIITQGSGTWTASKSEDWITLNATSGTVGHPVAYTVSATTNVEQRVGYIYVSGWTHTVTQDGVGGTISPESREFESMGDQD